MKICMIVPQRDVHGGIASVTSSYYGSRLEKDHQITYVESYCDDNKVHKLWKALTAYHQFRRVLKKDKPDLVHIHSSFGPSFYRKIPFILMAHRAGIPIVNHIHGSAFDELYDNASSRKKELVQNIYNKCDRLIVLADIWKEKFSQFYPAENIRIVPNYIEAHPELLTPEQDHARFAKHQILFLGVIQEFKGVKTFPRIMELVTAKFPDAQLIVGGIGDIDGLFAGANPQIMEHIHFPGWVRGSQKQQLLRESSIMLFPSHMESFGMTILEGFGYGLPVISCNAGAIPEVIDEGETGYITEIDDADAMADRIISLFSDEQLWTKMSHQGVTTAMQQYSLDHHFDLLENIYDELNIGQ